uniref:Uncharacterized protein n=1 Tax=Anopheles farauti TaxID=69004 RepID=A0A182QDW2_9DIPT
MQSATIMDMLTTPTTFPLKIDWEGKMEPSSPSDYSQQGFAEEESIFDADTYDFCNEGLFNNALIDLEDLKPDPSELLKGDVVVLPVVKLSEALSRFTSCICVCDGDDGKIRHTLQPLPPVSMSVVAVVAVAYRYTWNREIVFNSQKLVKRRPALAAAVATAAV